MAAPPALCHRHSCCHAGHQGQQRSLRLALPLRPRPPPPSCRGHHSWLCHRECNHWHPQRCLMLARAAPSRPLRHDVRCGGTAQQPSGRRRRKQHHGAARDSKPDTLYALLGVQPECSNAELRSAYRRLAAQLHPDVNPDASPGQFQAITQAFELLRDAALRRRYDTYGLSAFAASEYAALRALLAGGATEPGTRGPHGGGAAPGGSNGGGGGDARGEDVHTVLGLRLGEAVTGVERVVELQALGTCDLCQGSGREVTVAFLAGGGGGRGAVWVDPDCPVCHGSGEVLRTTWQPTGIKVVAPGTCPACGGKGTQAQAMCGRCGGEGRTHVTRRVRVRVPGGVSNSSVLRVAGCGHAGRWGGPSGDLLLRFKVMDEPDMERRGRHLYSTVTCGVWQAVLGGSLTVRSVRGERLLTIPPGSQHGDVLQLTHAGVAEVQAGGGVEHGHHFFQLNVAVPDGSRMAQDERDLLLRLQAAQAARSQA